MKDRTDSREKILTVAARLFQIKGYNSTGLNEIIKESGCPKGSLYYYFPNGKEELAAEAVKLAGQSIRNKMQIVLDQFSNPAEGIDALIRGIIENLEKDGKLEDTSLSLISLETYLSIEPLRKACESAFLSMQDLFRKKLRESRLSEETASELAVFIQVAMEGAITVSLTEKDPEALSTVSKQISILLNHYIET